MTPEQFMESFGAIAEAPGGIEKLRGLVELLGVTGQLSVKAGDADTLREKLERARKASGRKEKPRVVEMERDNDWSTANNLGWLRIRLGELIWEMDAGWSPKCEMHPTKTEDDWGVLMTTAIQRNSFEPGHHKQLPAKLEPRPNFEVAAGHLLVTRAGPSKRVGVAAHVDNCRSRLMVSDKIIRCRYFDDVADGRWLALCVNTGDGAKFLHAAQSGMDKAQMNISQSRLCSVPLMLPPLAEQKRIVARVDQLMAMLDDLEQRQERKRTVAIHVSKASLDSLVNAEDPDQLARAWERVSKNFGVVVGMREGLAKLRELIGVLACSGRLSSTNKNDGSVDQILDSVRAERQATGKKLASMSPLGNDDRIHTLPSTWRWVRVGELLLDSDAGKSPQCEERPRVQDEYGVLKVSAVSWGSFRPGENKALPADIKPFTAYEVHSGDFLLSRANTGELVARSVVVGETPSRLLMSDKIVRLHFGTATVPQFFSLYNNGPVARAYYLAHASGTSSSMKNVSRKVILELPVPLPPLAEQERIIHKVDQLMALLVTVEQWQEQERAFATRLSSAIGCGE